MAFDPDLDMALTCHLTVQYESPGLTIGVHYALYQPSGLYRDKSRGFSYFVECYLQFLKISAMAAL